MKINNKQLRKNTQAKIWKRKQPNYSIHDVDS